mmetsp:Transcript_27094/g.61215  ORF Transcript_27094/g.61215 Transcript_27094/m.61215 type:complete len:87 (-) Transcript_27094:27-287(-)
MVPALFRFPSAERLRFEARIRQMEVENRKVMNENERLSKVEMENEALRKQINQLKRDLTTASGSGGEKGPDGCRTNQSRGASRSFK